MRDCLARDGTFSDVVIASAGTSAEELGRPVYPPAQRILRAYGIDPAGKTARQLRREDYDAFDCLIAMDTANLRHMQRLFAGDPEQKITRLLDLSAHPRDIADPWYSGDFETTWDDIFEGCGLLLQSMKRMDQMHH